MVGKSFIYSEPVSHEPPTQVRNACQKGSRNNTPTARAGAQHIKDKSGTL